MFITLFVPSWKGGETADGSACEYNGDDPACISFREEKVLAEAPTVDLNLQQAGINYVPPKVISHVNYA